jgi:SnoaL-like protein
MDDFIARWAAAWGAPTASAVAALAADDIRLSWPGAAEPIEGARAWAGRVGGMLDRFPDLRLEVTGHAWREDVVFISWQGRATVGGTPVTWPGIDRMRLLDGRVAEALVTFDTGPLSTPAH